MDDTIIDYERRHSSKILTEPMDELCLIGAPSFVLTLETGKGKDTKPILLLQSNFNAQISQWSTNMNITSFLTLQMHYYNDEIALWEPMIEPVEIESESSGDKRVFHPWELKFELQMNNYEIVDTYEGVDSPSPSEDEEFKVTPKISIEVSSKDNLEITITKTSMQVMTKLGESFQAAVAEGVDPILKDFSPYKIVNDTGLKITLKLSKSSFQFYTKDKTDNEINEIIVESGAEVPLALNKNQTENYDVDLSKINLSSTYDLSNLIDNQLVIYVSNSI